MIIPAILETNFDEVKKKIDLIEALVGTVHIDISDGKFVDGDTFTDMKELDVVEDEIQLEVHLMVENPADYLLPIRNLTRVIAHVESDGVNEFIAKAKRMDLLIGLAVNPETDSSKLDPYIDKIDFVEFMTVKPGAQGRDFEESVFKKIVLFSEANPTIKIQADGGIEHKNIKKVIDSGVDDIVIGSAIFNSSDPVSSLEKFLNETK